MSLALAAVVLVRVVAAASGRSKLGAVAPTGRMWSSMPVREEGLHGFIRDGQTAGLDQGAGLGGDVVELGLEVGRVRHLILV